MQPAVFNSIFTILLGLALASPATSADTATSGAQVFAQHCAACHGTTGKPDPCNPALAGFDRLPANFSDPLFNSREPGADWLLVVEHGGPSLGLSQQMPAFGDVLSTAEIESAVKYAKSLAGTRDYPPGEFNYPLALRTKKAFPEDELVWKIRYTDQDGDDPVRNVLELEKRFGNRWQAIAELIGESEGGHDYIDEAELGLKYTLSWDLQKQYIISAGVVAAFPIHDDAASNEIIPMLMGAKALSDDFVAQGSFRAKLPVDRAADGEAEFAAAVHWLPSIWPRSVFPGLEFVATVPFEDNGGDSVQWSVLPQARIGLTRGGHVALNLGAEIPLSDQSWDWRGYLYLIWDFADGSFFKGW
jgi:mono/diheme cytochrome c family protein